MKTGVEEISSVKKRLVVDVDSKEVLHKVNDAYRMLGKRAKIPGFRTGKIPRKVLERYFGNQVLEDVTKDLVKETLPGAIEETGVIPELIKSASRLADRGIGAIIVMEKDMGLKNYIETGTKVDAKVTAELLETIFTPPSPLHDGAVIIQNDRIAAAGCILPLTQDQRLSVALGTRHRAAIGLTEETDAVVIVVSEETQTISYAEGGKLKRKIDINTLRTDLLKNFGLVAEEKLPKPAPAA